MHGYGGDDWRILLGQLPCAEMLLGMQNFGAHGITVASMNVLARSSADNDVHHVRARGGMASCCDVGPARWHACRIAVAV